MDTFTDKNNESIHQENLVYEFSFLDSNIDKAYELIEEYLSIPNFFDMTPINIELKQKSVEIANDISNNALSYAMSYASSGLKIQNEIYEKFASDLRICKTGADLLKTSNPKTILNEVSKNILLLHNLILKKDQISISINSGKSPLEKSKAKLSLILNSIKNENPSNFIFKY